MRPRNSGAWLMPIKATIARLSGTRSLGRIEATAEMPAASSTAPPRASRGMALGVDRNARPASVVVAALNSAPAGLGAS